jgi:selenocysteine lyase/cysteine desulfurase
MRFINVEEIRKNHPVAEHCIYLDHASTSPIPGPARDSMTELIERISLEGFPPMEEVEAVSREARELAARLAGAEPEEIAFVKNTSQGILLALQSIPWRAGDNVIVMKNAFPANIYPWLHLIPEVEKRWVSLVGTDQAVREIESRIDDRTRALALDWVHFASGARLDLEMLCRLCRDRGIHFIVDAIQGLGAVPFDSSHCDFMSSHAAKWMLGPIGIGVLFVSKKLLRDLVPANVGWISAEWEGFESLFPLPPVKTDASRYEEGSPNLIGIYGMRENLRLLLGLGIEAVWARILGLTDRLRAGLRDRGFEIWGPEEQSERSGIVSFRAPDRDTHAIFDRIQENGIKCSFREGHIRVSPHYYNTEEEIDALLNVL